MAIQGGVVVAVSPRKDMKLDPQPYPIKSYTGEPRLSQ